MTTSGLSRKNYTATALESVILGVFLNQKDKNAVPLLQVDALVAKLLQEEAEGAQQPAVLSGCRPEFGGSAEVLAASLNAVV